MAVLQRLDRRFHDVLGGAEVRLADAQVDDVASGGRECGGAREHREGVFLADALERRNGLEHGTSLCGLASGPDLAGFLAVIDFLDPFSAFSRRNQTDKGQDMVSSWPHEGG